MSEPTKPGGHPEEGRTRTTVSIDDLGLSMATTGEGAASPKGFLYAWFQLFRTAQIHAISNQALVRPVHKFISVTREILGREGSASFQAKDGSLFFNSVKLHLSSEEYYELAEPIFEFFEQRSIGGFVIEQELDLAAVHRLLEIMVYAQTERLGYKVLGEELRAAGLPMRVNKPLTVRGKSNETAVLERRAYTFLTYSKLVVLYRGLLTLDDANQSRRNFLLRKISRTIQSLVDVCLEDDHTFLGIISVKSADAYAAHHAANVTVLSIALGEKIGLRKADLADLGMAAVYCDVGLHRLPPEILDKQGRLDTAENAQMQRHTMLSVEFLLQESRLSKSVLRRVLVAFEHHRHHDGGGYPRIGQPPELFARIIAITDAYDALTSDRPWRKAHLPDEALGMIMHDAGTKFDPVLTKIFVNSVGLYPVGAVVRLSTGELAVVVYSGGEGERVTRPVVALLGSDGKPATTIDLCQKSPSGGYMRSIVSCEDPRKYGLQPSGLVAESPVA